MAGIENKVKPRVFDEKRGIAALLIKNSGFYFVNTFAIFLKPWRFFGILRIDFVVTSNTMSLHDFQWVRFH